MQTGRRSGQPDLEGQVALVTGAGRGIGRALALGLGACGARVAVVARSAGELDETAAAIVRQGGEALALPADVTSAAAMAEVLATATRQLGSVDLLVNCAGVGRPIGPLAEVDLDHWWRCQEVNLRGPLICCRLVLPGMIERRRGRIVNVASGAGAGAIANLSAYVVSKTALIRLTEVLALEVAPLGIQAFAIQPGTVRTAMVAELMDSEAGQRWLPWFREYVEDGRAVPVEVAVRLVRFLASGAGDALSGRYIDACDDYASLAARAEELRRDDLYVLRLRRSS